jgi:hypothetical protein
MLGSQTSDEKRENKTEELRSFLKLQLGEDAFNLAVSFSRSIAILMYIYIYVYIYICIYIYTLIYTRFQGL